MKTFQSARPQTLSRHKLVTRPAPALANRVALRDVLGHTLQTKLKVGAPDDAHEREADSIADQVMAAPEALVQRKCAACQNEDDEAKRKGVGGTALRIQRLAAPGAGRTPAAPASVGQVLASAGRPLDAPLRGDMEQRFGCDFSRVRVHSGGLAEQSAHELRARAYTVGQNIVFGASEFAPATSAGRRLLAHELVHTLQQSAGAATGVVQRTIGDGHDLQAARFAGDAVLEACFDDERLLQSGNRGAAVETLQQALIDAGFPLPRFGVDGIFGSETNGAVQDFQRAHGLDPDGLVGPLTMGALDTQFAAGPLPPGPLPPVPPPVPAETITSETVATSPGARTRTTIGVGERVDLTHAPGSAVWSTTGGRLNRQRGETVRLTAPDTTRRITVTAGGATLDFDVQAPTGVHMDRFAGTGVKHTLNAADSGIETLPFLLPDTVNFVNVRYRELNVGATVSNPGPYSCFNNFGHCRTAAGGACPDLALTDTVVAGKGTQAVLGDCVYSGDCQQATPFVAGNITFAIPYEYRVGTGAFRNFATVNQVSALAADLTTLSSDKAGAHGDTTVAAATVVIAACP